MIINPIGIDIEMKLPENYTFRRIENEDYERGVLEVLSQLTTVGNVSKDQFIKFVDNVNTLCNQYYTLVVVNGSDRIAAIGTIFIEKKLIHQCGIVGHIEDVAVGADEQGKGIGVELVSALDNIGRACGAYKNILNCSDLTRQFYEKCGYWRTDNMMTHRFF